MFWDNSRNFKTGRGNLGSQGDLSPTKPITQALKFRASHPEFICAFKLKHPEKGPMGWLAVQNEDVRKAQTV
jgi:hypothetical protein